MCSTNESIVLPRTVVLKKRARWRYHSTNFILEKLWISKILKRKYITIVLKHFSITVTWSFRSIFDQRYTIVYVHIFFFQKSIYLQIKYLNKIKRKQQLNRIINSRLYSSEGYFKFLCMQFFVSLCFYLTKLSSTLSFTDHNYLKKKWFL